MADESMLRMLEPDERAVFKMTLGGDGRSFSTRGIRKDYLNQPYTLDVTYRNGPEAPIQHVGRYALNLAKMLKAGLVRLERRRKGGEVVRMLVWERGTEFYIQLNQSGPSLRLPRG